MDDKIIKKFITYSVDENGNMKIEKLFSIFGDGSWVEEVFDMNDINDFFEENGINSDDPIKEAEEKGIFARFDQATLNRDNEAFREFMKPVNDLGEESPSPNEGTDEEKIDEEKESDDDFFNDEEEVEKDSTVAKRVITGVVAGALLAGGLTLLHSCSKEEIVNEKDNQDEDDLYKNMTEEQKAFFEPVFNITNEFNNKTTEEGNFKLSNDTSTLHLTVDEVMALNIIMNNYSGDDLYNIFGTIQFDTENLMDLSRSAYSKLSTYYMNATKPSGLSNLINDPVERAFFERHENAVIEFNNNPSVELSDNVIKGLYYDFVYAGSTGEYTEYDETKNYGSRWLATAPAFGYQLANRNIDEYLKVNNISEEEKAKYGDAAAFKGLSLNTVTTSELLTGINEKVDLDVIDEINNKSLCSAVTRQTKEKNDKFFVKQQIVVGVTEANAKNDLIEGLKKIGENNLANKVLVSSEISEDLLNEIRNSGKKANGYVDEYTTSVNALKEKEATLVAILEKASEKYNEKSEVDLPSLINNRFRTIEKKVELDNGKNVAVVGKDKNGNKVYDSNDINKLTPEEKNDFIKENGTVIKETTTTKEEEVKKEDLTKEEQQQVVNTESAMKEVDVLKASLQKKGIDDADVYLDEIGSYNYSAEIVNPYNNEKIDTKNKSLFNIVAYASAFGDGANNIDSNDSQIQERMNNDASKVTSEINSLSDNAKKYLQEKYGSNWQAEFIEESYKYGFTDAIDKSLNDARSMGAEVKRIAEEEYKKAQDAMNKKNEDLLNEETKVESTDDIVTPIVPVVPEYDPNIDPNYGQDDEIPYGVQVVENPFSLDWDAAYAEAVGTVKVK